MIENYLYRTTGGENTWVKNIVQPARTKRCLGAHVFEFDSGHAVDVAKRPLDGWLTQSYIQSRLRINHYYTKSLEELQAKFAKTRADTGELRPPLDLVTLLEARGEERARRDDPAIPARAQEATGLGLAAGAEPVDRPVQGDRVDAPARVLAERAERRDVQAQARSSVARPPWMRKLRRRPAQKSPYT